MRGAASDGATTSAVASMSCKRGSFENGVWNNPHCPVGHALQGFVEEEGGECDGCGAAVHAGDTVMDCRTCDWYLCGRCIPESNILHRALIACLTDADVAPAVRRAVMTMHHASPKAAQAENLDYLREKLRCSAYDRRDEVFTHRKGELQRRTRERLRREREEREREAPHRFKDCYTTTDWEDLNFYVCMGTFSLDNLREFMSRETNNKCWLVEIQESIMVIQKLR